MECVQHCTTQYKAGKMCFNFEDCKIFFRLDKNQSADTDVVALSCGTSDPLLSIWNLGKKKLDL